MRRTTEDLDCKRGLDAARALFQISDVLLLGFADSAKRSAEANAHAILRLFARVVEVRVLQREPRRHDCELSVTIQPFQSMWQKVFFGIPIPNLARASHMEHARIEACDAVDPALFCEDPFPKPIHTSADACDRPDTGDDRTPSGLPRRSLLDRRAHAVTLSAFPST